MLEAQARERMLSAQNNRAAREIIPEQVDKGKATEHAARIAKVPLRK